MEHGKRWTFVKYKCRCAECHAANDRYMVAYRQKNKEKILDKEAERYQRNKDAIIARVNEYYQREKTSVMRQRQTQRGRTKRSAWQQARRARKLKQFVEDVDPLEVYARREGICGICRRKIAGDFHVDHIISLSRGGLHSYQNAQPAHPRCNERKRDRLPTIAELEASYPTV